jgi:hypothetical protein
MIGELISGASSFLGGLFGKKEQKTTTEVDYVKMARNATKAGFNPLTAIRYGGSAGFTTTTSPTVSQLPQALASLGGTLGQAYEDKIDPLKQKQRQYDTALVDYQLRQLKEGPKAMPGRLYPSAQTTGVKISSFNKPGQSGAFIGPNLPPGSGPNGEIEPAMVAWRRSDGSLMYTYNPNFPDGDAAIGAAVADGANRAREEVEKRRFPKRDLPGSVSPVVRNGRAYRVYGKPYSRGNAPF